MHMVSFDKDERLSRRLKRRFGLHLLSPPHTHLNNSTSLDITVVPNIQQQEVLFDSDYAFYFVSHPALEDDYDDSNANDDHHSRENGSVHLLEFAFNDHMPLQTIDGQFVAHDHITPNHSKRFKDVPSRDGFKTKRLFRGREEKPKAFRSVPNKKTKISSTVKDITPKYLKALKDVPSRDGFKTKRLFRGREEKPKAFRSVPNKKTKISSTVKDITPKYLKVLKDVPSRDGFREKRVFRNSDKYKEKSKALRSVLNKKSKISSTMKNEKLECAVNVTATQKQKPRPLMPEVKQEMESAIEEEEDCYESFLKCMKLDGANLVMVTKDGKMTKYENASDSDFDIEMTDAPQLGAPSPFVSSKIYCLDEKSKRSDSKFREKLTNIFRKPFDQKEYNELYKEVSERKSLERCKESCGRTRRCVILESVSKSYLDHHTDLANEIHSVRRNPYMILKLLRGFFFWLKNVAEDGGFRPWSDESCLKEIRQR